MKNENLGWMIILIAVLLFVFGGFGFGLGGYGGMMGMMYGTYSTPMMFFGWLYGILTLAVLILLVIWLYRQIQK